VYRHSSSGWSKYDNGSWNQVQKPSQSTQAAGTRPNQALATTQRQPAPGGSANPGYRSTSAGAQNRSFQSSSYGQLEQDRQAQSFGGQQFGGGAQHGQFGGGGGRRFR
jgi:hypothetical protein